MHYKEYKSILSPQNGMNIYRGCTNGCIYCDSRSVCYQMQHDFEDIEIKENAPQMLENTLRFKHKKGVIGTGAMSDPYIHLESELFHTRQCLEIIDKYGFGVAIQTKSANILRDLDVLKRINSHSKCVVQMTLTTFDEELCKILEPRVSTTRERFEALKVFRDNSIETVVWMTPILPFINDTKENIKGLLDYCTLAKVRGILTFGMGLTLREGNREYFYQKLDEHFPGMKQKYTSAYGNRYELNSPHNRELMAYLNKGCKDNGIMVGSNKIFEYLHKYEEKGHLQLSLFD